MEVFPYSKQSITEKDIKYVLKVLNSDFITQGSKINEFERKLSKYCNVKYSVVLNSGTSALFAAYHSIGLKRDNEFITSPITFSATANAGVYLGAKPIFVDVEYNNGNINCDKIEENISEDTRLIVPMHYAGLPVNLDKIKKLADKYNLNVIEDAAHALGASYKNTKIGNCEYSDITILSFHPVKSITTGEGGAVLTNDEEIYQKVLRFRNHGIVKNQMLDDHNGDWYYEIHELGYNFRITDIQCALGISQLDRLDTFIKKRREIANQYDQAFKDNNYFDTLSRGKDCGSSVHLYPIRLKEKYLKKKKTIFKKLRDNKLWVQVHYIPVYTHPFYQNLGYRKGLCPIAEKFYKGVISIPVYPTLTKNQVDKIIDIIFNVFKEIK